MSAGESCGSPRQPHLQLPSPVTTRRTRTASTSERAFFNPEESGIIKSFCRERGHGFVTPNTGGDDLFVHISDVEGEYIPLPGDEVRYRLCPIPPKFEKCQAVSVHIVHLTPEKHLKWDQPIIDNMRTFKRRTNYCSRSESKCQRITAEIDASSDKTRHSSDFDLY